MATKATTALHPEWEPVLGRVDGREAAIKLDSLRTTHPVVQRLQTVEQMSQAFDAITYQKGEAVITMLEDYVGEEAWRNGVRTYIPRHRLGNTQSDDLWRAIEEASGRPVTAIAHDFTLQPGVPLIRVESARCVGGRTQVAFRQGQFSRDNPDAQPLAWRVPVIAQAGGGRCAPWSGGADAGDRARLRPARRQLRPGRLLPDALRAGAARQAHPQLCAAPAARPDRPARRQLGARPRRLSVARGRPRSRRGGAGERQCPAADPDRQHPRPARRHVRERSARTAPCSPASPPRSWARRCAGSAGRRAPASRPTTRCCAAS